LWLFMWPFLRILIQELSMRVLHVILTPRYSGAEILVRDLARIDAEQGHDVAIIALNPSEPEFECEVSGLQAIGVDWFLPKAPLRRVGRLYFLRRWVKEFRPEVIAAHTAIPSLYARIALLCVDVPIVSVLHAVNDYGVVKLAWMERLFRHKASVIASVSQLGLQNYVSQVGGQGLMRFLPNGIDSSRFLKALTSRERYRADWGLKEPSYVVIQVGRIDSVKRQHLSLKATLPLFAEHPGLMLWFVGLVEDSNYYKYLRNLIAEYGCEDRVEFFGSRSDVPQLLSAADLFLMPSAWESQGIAYLEGLASGLPVIASNISVFSFAKALPGATLLDPENTAKFSDAIRTFIRVRKRYDRNMQQFSIYKTANAYHQIFKEII